MNYIPDTSWDCHMCPSVGVIWGVNVGIYAIHGVSGYSIYAFFNSHMMIDLHTKNVPRSSANPCTMNHVSHEIVLRCFEMYGFCHRVVGLESGRLHGTTIYTYNYTYIDRPNHHPN